MGAFCRFNQHKKGTGSLLCNGCWLRVVLSICVNLGERAPFVMAFIFLVMAFASATHDISTDGFYLESLSHSEQAKLSGLQVACYRLALLFGSGVVVVVAGKFLGMLHF